MSSWTIGPPGVWLTHSMIGTLGILLAAKRHGLVDRVGPLLDDLHNQRFFMGRELHRHLLQVAGEAADEP